MNFKKELENQIREMFTRTGVKLTEIGWELAEEEILETATSIMNLVDKDIIGEDELPIDIHLTDKNTAIFLNNKIAFCNGLRKEQRNKLRDGE